MMGAHFATAAQQVAILREGKFVRSISDILLISQRNLLLDLRNPGVIIGATGFPVFLLLIFTASFTKVVFPQGSYADYAQFIVPLSIVQGLLFSTISMGTALYSDLESGMDIRLRTLPITRSAVLAGRIFGGAARLLIQVIVIISVGYLLGFRFQTGKWAIFIFLILPVIFTASFAWITLFIATKAKAVESIQVAMISWLLPLTFLSTGFVSKESFPNWLQGFIAVNPISLAVQALRNLSFGEPAAESVVATLLWSAAIAAVFSPLAIRAYQRRAL